MNTRSHDRRHRFKQSLTTHSPHQVQQYQPSAPPLSAVAQVHPESERRKDTYTQYMEWNSNKTRNRRSTNRHKLRQFLQPPQTRLTAASQQFKWYKWPVVCPGPAACPPFAEPSQSITHSLNHSINFSSSSSQV